MNRLTVLLRLHPLLLVALFLAGCSTAPRTGTPDGSTVEVPEPNREFRAAWVATVANIDWPSKPGLSTEAQKAEATAILDRLVSLNMNAVVFQVRPHGDALYQSAIEPWSSYLTGEQGEAPSPFYDPLQFWIEESHKRGIQLHAWLNPYRANHPSNKGGVSELSIVKRRPDLVHALAQEGYVWMDPSHPEVQDHCASVVADLVTRYDLDGIHFDDYFYPYPSYNEGEEFPDGDFYEAYRADGGELSRDDWRRAAVDGLIERLYGEIKSIKPHVEFSLSPFGIYRPGHPKSIEGFDQYASLYADARKWLNEGWVDFFVPQLYWPISRVPQSFPVLLGWWHEENHFGRHIWPGTSVPRMKGEEGRTELLNQIMVTRGMRPEDPGLCLFSMKWLMRKDDLLGPALKKGPYREQALVPASSWLDAEGPEQPNGQALWLEDGIEVRFSPQDSRDVCLWVVSSRRGDDWQHQILPGHVRSARIKGATFDAVAITAVDRCRNRGRSLVIFAAAGEPKP